MAFSLTKDAVVIDGRALDAIPDDIAGGQRRNTAWRKTILHASAWMETIIKS